MDNTNEDERYMRMALREAEKAFDEKEIPIGCVIVKDGVVIGKGAQGRYGPRRNLVHRDCREQP